MNDDNEIIKYINSLGNVKIIDENFYSLISRNDIKKVVSISSGTCCEARYFQKEAEFLLKEGVPRQTCNNVELDKYVSIYQDFFSLNFWSHILEPFVETKKFDRKITIEGAANKLRNSRIKSSVYYAYEDANHMALKSFIEKNLASKIHKSFLAYTIEKDAEL